MPKLVSMYIRHVLIGFGLAGVFVGLLLWMNVGNLWHLVTHSDVGIMAVAMLFFGNAVVFSGVQFAIAIMRMGDDAGPRGGKRRPVATRIPARVEAVAPTRRDR
ncbi:MAG: hypothetical protein ACU0CY_02435 [Maritimibacter harenae]|jgi:hypothetical protein